MIAIRKRPPVQVGHACDTCFDTCSTNADGTSRCLWSSRDGVTPNDRPSGGRRWSAYMCSQPSRNHTLDGIPHTFTIYFPIRVSGQAAWRTAKMAFLSAFASSVGMLALIHLVFGR